MSTSGRPVISFGVEPNRVGGATREHKRRVGRWCAFLARVRRALIAILAAVALTGCGSSSSGSSSKSSITTTTGSTTAAAPTGGQTATGCKSVSIPAPQGSYHLKPPTHTLDPAKTYTVHVTTNCGSFAFTLNVAGSPKTASSVYALVKSGFYDNLTFHRIVPGFVIQGGDPAGNGTGGPGYTVVDAPPASLRYATGDVAMAKTAAQPPGTSGSQFFVVLSAAGAAQLTPVYALLGKVVSGMNVVERIGGLPTNSAEYPRPPVVMSRVTVSVS
jgi:cyclophilin family peptidyl-prolyl cis-trans isomerase